LKPVEEVVFGILSNDVGVDSELKETGEEEEKKIQMK
jgi:hypothetical protein